MSWIPCTSGEFKGACCTTFLGGKDLPATTASLCSFLRIAQFFFTNWSFRADAWKFLLPRNLALNRFCLSVNNKLCKLFFLHARTVAKSKVFSIYQFFGKNGTLMKACLFYLCRLYFALQKIIIYEDTHAPRTIW